MHSFLYFYLIATATVIFKPSFFYAIRLPSSQLVFYVIFLMCRIGEEKVTVMQLMRKMIAYQEINHLHKIMA